MKVWILQRIQRDTTVPGSYYEPGDVAELELPVERVNALIDAGIVALAEPVGAPAELNATQIMLEDGVDDSEASLAGKALQKRSYPRGGGRHG